jgi:hypothetical protein
MKIHVKYNDKRRQKIKKTMEFMLKIKKELTDSRNQDSISRK